MKKFDWADVVFLTLLTLIGLSPIALCVIECCAEYDIDGKAEVIISSFNHGAIYYDDETDTVVIPADLTKIDRKLLVRNMGYAELEIVKHYKKIVRAEIRKNSKDRKRGYKIVEIETTENKLTKLENELAEISQ